MKSYGAPLANKHLVFAIASKKQPYTPGRAFHCVTGEVEGRIAPTPIPTPMQLTVKLPHRFFAAQPRGGLAYKFDIFQ